MSNALAKKDIYLVLSIDDDGFGFATSIDDALAQAEAELVVMNETVESIKELKSRGVWVYGTAAGADAQLYKTDLTGPCAIVIGNEGDGMSRLVADSCDFKLSIPMKGRISSLNASAAAAILLYEARRQRG